MKFLMQEFFEKIFGFINGIDFFLMKLVIKIIFAIVSIAIVVFLILLFYTKNGYLVLILFGAYILAEIFHFIRKIRESIMFRKMIKEESKIIKQKR